MEESRLFEWADKLKALRDRKDDLEAELKQVIADIDNADWHLSNLMVETETQNFTREAGLPRGKPGPEGTDSFKSMI